MSGAPQTDPWLVMVLTRPTCLAWKWASPIQDAVHFFTIVSQFGHHGVDCPPRYLESSTVFHMAKPDRLDCYKYRSYTVLLQLWRHASYTAIGFVFSLRDPSSSLLRHLFSNSWILLSLSASRVHVHFTSTWAGSVLLVIGTRCTL